MGDLKDLRFMVTFFGHSTFEQNRQEELPVNKNGQDIVGGSLTYDVRAGGLMEDDVAGLWVGDIYLSIWLSISTHQRFILIC